MVSRSDIEHLTAQKLVPESIAEAPLIPYCFDFRAGTIIFSAAIDPERATEAEFHYDYLRSQTRLFVELPGQSIQLPGDASFPEPVLLFSPGRCGSTLLAKVIRALGSVCISEPDFYSQAAIHAMLSGGLSVSDRHLLKTGQQILVSPWMQSQHPIVLKMRSHANHAPMALLPDDGEPTKTIFLMRRFEPWCESRMRAFSNSLKDNINIYMDALKALSILQQKTQCLLLDYDEVDAASLAWGNRLARFLELPFNEKAVTEVLAKDAQAGTALAKNRLARSLPLELREEIASAWQRTAPRDLLAQIGLAHYANP